ncbi:tetraprenyl-beta-curcumene synthase family protein [Tuberibacillus calidus]|uniref:tetraprenyl-beta-curcumene synthase family protein n=1 Tax=Tuberibacillus calidus TaxID=340097 RepID=UPI0004105A9D|nr:tetraprenyl-beta-curcumene synthase family protein [Tuberibacillus calidus]
MTVPTHPWHLMKSIYRDVLPTVKEKLAYWTAFADAIPNEELRKQALASIRTKTFHCEGGAVYGLLAKERREEVISFIVAYQTISDYLDNLCDRSTSQDPDDFRLLHASMMDALTPGSRHQYYEKREDRDDGGYLSALVETCQKFLETLPSLPVIQPYLHELASYYCDLQVHKHVAVEERVGRLTDWFETHKPHLPEMTWYEFSACSGSTLGIFCLVAYAAAAENMEELAGQIKNGYFPWVQGLHILLDYFIDQDEDRAGGDLNFCSFYESEEMMFQRFIHFMKQADRSIVKLPDAPFHRMVNRGLIGIYLADQKVQKQRSVRNLARKILLHAGGTGWFFLLNGWLYRRMKPRLFA